MNVNVIKIIININSHIRQNQLRSHHCLKHKISSWWETEINKFVVCFCHSNTLIGSLDIVLCFVIDFRGSHEFYI